MNEEDTIPADTARLDPPFPFEVVPFDPVFWLGDSS
jgi:hypothetical protein